MRLLTKEFYTLAELQAAWDMADQDIQYLIATGRLKLSIVVYLRSRGITMPLPQSIRYREGAMRQYGALVSAYARSILGMYGPTTLSKVVRTMVASSASYRSSMKRAGSVWPYR